MLHQTSPVKIEIRHDWTTADVAALFAQPFSDLIFHAQAVHRRHFKANELQMSQLLSIKTGGCPEDCGYCSQSAKYDTGLRASKLMEVEAVIEEAKKAKDNGASRYCLGAAWRGPRDRDMDQLCAMVRGLKALGLETCMTLGMLTDAQADRLKEAGLDYYNHNIDTSPRYYREVTTTRSFQDRLDTLERVRNAGMKVCCGGIIGMGEQREDRIDMLLTLANLQEPPESVPINGLMPTTGTPLGNSMPLDPIEFVRTIAVARILMPKSVVRLSAGRENMSDEMQALCFLAGANSVFVGDRLLTTDNPERDKDARLFEKLGLEPAAHSS